jgi:N-acetyl-anhydromuramyl-L-alanine amidase AmpD
MNTIWKGSQHTNKSSRHDYKPCAIVNHVTTGTAESAIEWFTSPYNKESSCHFLVDRKGNIWQFVDTEMNAWHAGLSESKIPLSPAELVKEMQCGVNNYTIGIEHEGYDGHGIDGKLTEDQYASTLYLHIQLIDMYQIPVSRTNILGHYEVNPWEKQFCPGINFPWSRLMNDLQNHYKAKEILKMDDIRKALNIPDASWAKDQVELLKQRNLIKDDHDVNEILTFGVFATVINNIYDELKKLVQLK